MKNNPSLTDLIFEGDLIRPNTPVIDAVTAPAATQMTKLADAFTSNADNIMQALAENKIDQLPSNIKAQLQSEFDTIADGLKDPIPGDQLYKQIIGRMKQNVAMDDPFQVLSGAELLRMKEWTDLDKKYTKGGTRTKMLKLLSSDPRGFAIREFINIIANTPILRKDPVDRWLHLYALLGANWGESAWGTALYNPQGAAGLFQWVKDSYFTEAVLTAQRSSTYKDLVSSGYFNELAKLTKLDVSRLISPPGDARRDSQPLYTTVGSLGQAMIITRQKDRFFKWDGSKWEMRPGLKPTAQGAELWSWYKNRYPLAFKDYEAGLALLIASLNGNGPYWPISKTNFNTKNQMEVKNVLLKYAVFAYFVADDKPIRQLANQAAALAMVPIRADVGRETGDLTSTYQAPLPVLIEYGQHDSLKGQAADSLTFSVPEDRPLGAIIAGSKLSQWANHRLILERGDGYIVIYDGVQPPASISRKRATYGDSVARSVAGRVTITVLTPWGEALNPMGKRAALAGVLIGSITRPLPGE